jgi:hypothetical protein
MAAEGGSEMLTRWHQGKRIKRTRTTKCKQPGLVPLVKEESIASMEEIRREGLILASQAFGEGVRSAPTKKPISHMTPKK